MISYKKSSRAKHIRITVHRDLRVVVTVPKRVPLSQAESFVQGKKAWIESSVQRLSTFAPQQGIPRATRKDFLLYKEQARILVEKLLAHFTTFYGYTWNNVTIRNTTSRWGSCSKKKNLSFNYRIALLPKELAEYLVVHELCHLGEFNHSKNFWKLIEKTVPDYKLLRKRLKNIA